MQQCCKNETGGDYTPPVFHLEYTVNYNLPDSFYDPRPIYYTYILYNQITKQPFYVGRGCGDRINVHEREARRGVQSHKCNTIRKIWSDGGHVGKVFYITDVAEEIAARAEMFLITLWGRRDQGSGILTNLTNGGEGKQGVRFTNESRAKMSNTRRGVPKSEEFKQKVSNTLKGRIFSDEHREKLSLAAKKRYQIERGEIQRPEKIQPPQLKNSRTESSIEPQIVDKRDFSKIPSVDDLIPIILPTSNYDSDKKYFVFMLIDPFSNQPFFINKGSTRNALPQHESEARTNKKGLKCDRIREIWNKGGTIIRHIFCSNLDEETAVRYVMGLIAYYGRLDNSTGILTNRTDGGPGKTGVVTSVSTRLKRLRHTRCSNPPLT